MLCSHGHLVLYLDFEGLFEVLFQQVVAPGAREVSEAGLATSSRSKGVDGAVMREMDPLVRG